MPSGDQPKLLVLDSSFFIERGGSAVLDVPAVVPLSIREELSRKGWGPRLDLLEEVGKLHVEAPSSRSVERVRVKAVETGDSSVLSPADVDLLALALDKSNPGGPGRVALVTDDYAVQNVAAALGLWVLPARKSPIRDRIDWVTYCPACREVSPREPVGSPCPTCGTPLRRRRHEAKPL
ncbi:MAG: NOB1 family endonuclease [Promethearchaeota archaeon]